MSSNVSKIRLEHCKLGHPPFILLKQMFPILFKNFSIESLYCDSFEYAKHDRVSFPASNKLVSQPFSLVHTDVSDPTKIPNVNGSRWFIFFIDDHARTT